MEEPLGASPVEALASFYMVCMGVPPVFLGPLFVALVGIFLLVTAHTKHTCVVMAFMQSQVVEAAGGCSVSSLSTVTELRPHTGHFALLCQGV